MVNMEQAASDSSSACHRRAMGAVSVHDCGQNLHVVAACFDASRGVPQLVQCEDLCPGDPR